MYRIEYRRDLNLLDIVWSGLITPEEILEYVEDCRRHRVREGFTSGYRLRITLADDLHALPQETLKVLSGAFANFPRSGRSAIVTRSAIARLQIKRALMAHHRIFESSAEALEWLSSE